MTWWRRLVGEHQVRAGRLHDADAETRFEAWASMDLRNVDRLMVGLHWWDMDLLALDVSWGHKGSDPVWSVGLAARLPMAVADWLGRHKVGS